MRPPEQPRNAQQRGPIARAYDLGATRNAPAVGNDVLARGSAVSAARGKRTIRALASCVDRVAFRPALGDFARTAALVEHIDIVIAVDTSVAHPSGAMGRPTWTVLPFNPHWRWLLEGEDSPWYPTARLYAPPARVDRASLMARVRDELASNFGERQEPRR